MKYKYTLGVIITATLFSTHAFANDAGELYAGGQFAQAELDGADVKPSAAVGRLGYFVVDNFAVEGRLGVGVGDDSALGRDVEIDSVAGLYGVGHLPLGDIIASVYAVAGFSRGEATVSTPMASISVDDTSFSYGVGLQAKFAPTFSGNVEYISYIDSDVEITAIGLGLNYHFDI
ncbi:porin family protein [Halomonas sp. TBZ9]|uniref:Porin family protein n=1 Tax=Vreelandella azerica TaxID=2732867 RepID=A0A7Y3U0K9_9GAMM|nr:porin family protein [Halomonas azerica]NOG32917.1 porin family protein [Halomonas azerica]